MLARKLLEVSRGWQAVYAHWLVPSAVVSALMIGKRIPLVAIAHSGDVHLLRRLRLVSIVAAGLASVDAQIAFVSEQLRDLFLSDIGSRRLRQAVANRSIVQPVGVDVARFERASQRVERRPGRVVFVGRLVPIKGVDVLLGAAAKWRASELVIAGDGPDRQRLEEMTRKLGVASKVRFTGFARGEQRDELLASASAVVIPSIALPHRTEGTPAVALEAMAASAPVIASATGGLASLPVMRVAPNDPDALAAAVDRVLMGEEAQVSIQKAWVNRHNWPAFTARLETLLAAKRHRRTA
jgi:glycosyltransferase involved in cell wall biosynthesis